MTDTYYFEEPIIQKGVLTFNGATKTIFCVTWALPNGMCIFDTFAEAIAFVEKKRQEAKR